MARIYRPDERLRGVGGGGGLDGPTIRADKPDRSALARLEPLDGRLFADVPERVRTLTEVGRSRLAEHGVAD